MLIVVFVYISSVGIRRMKSQEDGQKVDRAQTPLSSIALAFEEISDLIKKGDGNDPLVDLPLKPFCEACSLVSVLFGCLGIAFKFAEMEYTAKGFKCYDLSVDGFQLKDLLEASKSFDTLSSVVDYDLKNKTVKSPGSHTRNLRRVRQGLDLIKELFQNFLSPENLSLKTAATTAYQQTCAPYHTWAVRTAASAGMCTLPTREQLLLNLNETDKSADKEMRRYIKASIDVIKIIDNLYISRGIKLDW
ncbi:putative glycolipid transfer protein [Helianthus anomalus]